MDIKELWEKALKTTQIIRPRVKELESFEKTPLPYILLSPCLGNKADTLVRKGNVIVEKPALLLPSDSPVFEGFDFLNQFKLSEGLLMNFLFVRGVRFPSLKYNNQVDSVETFKGCLKSASGFFLERLEREEEVHTGLVSGEQDCWQFSLLIFISSLIARDASGDIKRIIQDLQRRKNQNFN